MASFSSGDQMRSAIARGVLRGDISIILCTFRTGGSLGQNLDADCCQHCRARCHDRARLLPFVVKECRQGASSCCPCCDGLTDHSMPKTDRLLKKAHDGMNETRKIAAILAADIVGYSRLTGADEDRTLARLRTLWSDLFD